MHRQSRDRVAQHANSDVHGDIARQRLCGAPVIARALLCVISGEGGVQTAQEASVGRDRSQGAAEACVSVASALVVVCVVRAVR